MKRDGTRRDKRARDTGRDGTTFWSSRGALVVIVDGISEAVNTLIFGKLLAFSISSVALKIMPTVIYIFD
jgi:hypothetical protein